MFALRWHGRPVFGTRFSIIILRLTRRKPSTMCAKLSVGWKTRVSSVLSTCRHTKVLRVTMWSLIPQKLMPPTRVVRYCCSVLKEQGGKGRMITTGVRWAESAKRRKNRGIYEKQSADISRRITISNDNDDARRLFENCRLQAKRVCNPIVDWTDSDVWGYIRSEHIPVNLLYERGFHRVGCIGCPLAGRAGRQFEFGRYPTYRAGVPARI